MAFDVNNPYFRTKVLTASPEELRLLLIEGAIRFLKSGRDGLDSRNYEKVYDAFTNARNIILELASSLRHDVAPELCSNLESIYNYVFRLTVEGSFEKDSAKINEAISLLEYDRETWILLMERLEAEKTGAKPAAASPADLHSSARPALSVQG